MATKATDIDVSLFNIEHLEDSTTVSSQKIAWINYGTNRGKLNIQTPVFVTECSAGFGRFSADFGHMVD